jgi:hypothetical protein
MIGEELWRFSAIIISPIDSSIDYCWENPVKITAAGKLVGFGSVIETYARQLMVDCAVEYELPERLDFENGVPVFVLPFCEVKLVTLFTKNERTEIHIRSLELRYDCDNPEIPKIGGPV